MHLTYTAKPYYKGEHIKDGAGTTDLLPSVDLANAEHLSKCTWQKFPAGVSWTPQRLEVNGRKGRRVACVVAEDGFHYRVYDLDSSPSIDENEDSRMEGSDETLP